MHAKSPLPSIIVFLQVRCTAAQRSELRDLVAIFRGHILDVSQSTVTIELQVRLSLQDLHHAAICAACVVADQLTRTLLVLFLVGMLYAVPQACCMQ